MFAYDSGKVGAVIVAGVAAGEPGRRARAAGAAEVAEVAAATVVEALEVGGDTAAGIVVVVVVPGPSNLLNSRSAGSRA